MQYHLYFLHLLTCLLIFLHKSYSAREFYPSTTPEPPQCTEPMLCEPLVNHTCLGAKLPYAHTSLSLINSTSQAEIHRELQQWRSLQHVPKCWEVIQPLLCSVYLPHCKTDSEGTEKLVLPSRELCEITRQPCAIVQNHRGWPEFLQCDQPHFKEGCKDSLRNVKFNTTSQCMKPLVLTNKQDSWYADVDGCGVQCDNPLFTAEEHQHVHTFVAVIGSVCLTCCLFAVFTFLIDWRNAARYPALILFFINLCYSIGCIGWLAQFIPAARRDIVCRNDGTLRRAEPQIQSGETAACSVVFVLIYFSLVATSMWFALLAYAWNLTFQALGSTRDMVGARRGLLHLVAWSVPLVLTIVCLTVSQIEGDSLSGICFIGNVNFVYRVGFVLIPVGAVVVVGLFFLIRALFTLLSLHHNTPDFISDKATSKIRDTIIRIAVFVVLVVVFISATCAVHVYMFLNKSKWEQSLRDYIICKALLRSKHGGSCELSSRPSMAAVLIQIFSYFGVGIAMSSWVWTAASLDAWRRFGRRVCNLPNNEPIKLKKHRMIAQAFNQRHNIRNGHLSISFHSSHDDPLGMKFELNSESSSQELTSAWAAAIPRMMRRRGGLVYPTAGNGRRYSDSDLASVASFQAECRMLTVESRRVSVESHVSMSELEEPVRPKRKNRKKKKQRNKAKNKVTPVAPAAAAVPMFGGSRYYDPHRRGSWPRRSSAVSTASEISYQVSLDQFSSSELNLRDAALTHKYANKTTTTTSYSMFTASGYVPQTLEMHDLDGLESDDLGLESGSRSQAGWGVKQQPVGRIERGKSNLSYNHEVKGNQNNWIELPPHPNAVVEIEDLDSDNSSIMTQYSQQYT